MRKPNKHAYPLLRPSISVVPPPQKGSSSNPSGITSAEGGGAINRDPQPNGRSKRAATRYYRWLA
eukprot:471697-Pleurochrysis_carterae.AAC.2